MQCPKCSIEMDEVRKLDVIIDACSKCGGIWLDRGELDKIRQAESARQVDEGRGDAGFHGDEKHTRPEAHGKREKPRKSKFGNFMEIFESFGE